MIKCKFTEEELKLMKLGLKCLYNTSEGRKVLMYTLSDCEDEHDAFQLISELRGNISSLIRNYDNYRN